MKSKVIEWEGNKPVVFMPAGTKLSKKFTLRKDRAVTVRSLLIDGDQNTKLRKSNKSSTWYKTYGLTLAPAKLAGVGNLCPNASTACEDNCLDESGMRSVWESIHVGKIARTIVFQTQRQWFVDRLAVELANKIRSRIGGRERLAVRLNVMSDFPWESTGIIDAFPQVEFYDYSKSPKRTGLVRPNYWVTFSRSETNDQDAINVLDRGHNVAVVFASSLGRKFTYLPDQWNGSRVIDGDQTDLRFLDDRSRNGVVVGLRLKTATNAQYQQACQTGFPVMVN